jgi:glutathione S-transferase
MLNLIQFRYSPYNEKVRWAFDFKQMPHTRRSLLPGPHLPVVKRLSGNTTTPVLIAKDQVIDGSANIIAWLEQQQPTPSLLPAQEDQRLEILRIQKWFDDDITPRLRRTILDALMKSPRYFASVFGAGHSNLARAAYALTLPLAKPLIRRANGIRDAASIADGHEAIEQALDFVAKTASTTGYLVGTGFSLADLVAASSLAVVVDPPDSSMARPLPHSADFAAFVARHASHPGAQWVRDIYRLHRGSITDFNGRSTY